MPRNRSTPILLFAAALAMFGVAALIVHALSTTGGIDTAFDAHRYLRICGLPLDGTCLEFTARQSAAVALAAVACGTGLMVLGVRVLRNASKT